MPSMYILAIPSLVNIKNGVLATLFGTYKVHKYASLAHA